MTTPSRALPSSLTSSATTQSRTSRSTHSRSRQLVQSPTFCLSIRMFLRLLLPFVRPSSKGFIDSGLLLYTSNFYSHPTPNMGRYYLTSNKIVISDLVFDSQLCVDVVVDLKSRQTSGLAPPVLRCQVPLTQCYASRTGPRQLEGTMTDVDISFLWLSPSCSNNYSLSQKLICHELQAKPGTCKNQWIIMPFLGEFHSRQALSLTRHESRLRLCLGCRVFVDHLGAHYERNHVRFSKKSLSYGRFASKLNFMLHNKTMDTLGLCAHAKEHNFGISRSE
jgi:hypothetical protein